MWGSGEEEVMTFFDLFQGIRVVVGCDGDVAAVEDFAPEIERVGCERSDVVSAIFSGSGWSSLCKVRRTHCIRH